MKETAVTIRERALEELAAAGPQGLTMDRLATAVSGPWQDPGVRAVLRRLWDAGELARREDGTFVQSGWRAHDSRYRMDREQAAEQRVEAAVRRLATVRSPDAHLQRRPGTAQGALPDLPGDRVPEAGRKVHSVRDPDRHEPHRDLRTRPASRRVAARLDEGGRP